MRDQEEAHVGESEEIRQETRPEEEGPVPVPECERKPPAEEPKEAQSCPPNDPAEDAENEGSSVVVLSPDRTELSVTAPLNDSPASDIDPFNMPITSPSQLCLDDEECDDEVARLSQGQLKSPSPVQETFQEDSFRYEHHSPLAQIEVAAEEAVEDGAEPADDGGAEPSDSGSKESTATEKKGKAELPPPAAKPKRKRTAAAASAAPALAPDAAAALAALTPNSAINRLLGPGVKLLKTTNITPLPDYAGMTSPELQVTLVIGITVPGANGRRRFRKSWTDMASARCLANEPSTCCAESTTAAIRVFLFITSVVSPRAFLVLRSACDSSIRAR